MKSVIYKLLKITGGLFLFALGIVMTINANLGLAPWDILHEGLAKTFGMTIGTANIIVGLIIVIIEVAFGANVGWGTIMNMLLIGTFIDILMFNNLIPTFTGLIPSLIMIFLGLLIQGVGCWIYLLEEMGAGPRDGLMVLLTKKTGKPVKVTKVSAEVLATVIGYLLGGTIGIGTLIMAFMGGHSFQLVFNIAKFDVNNVENRHIVDDIKFVKEKIKSIKNNNSAS